MRSLPFCLYYLAIENANLLFGMYHDDAVYMVCAKSLADGDGYRILSLPGAPPQSKYPVGFPLFLALLWKVFPVFPGNLLPFEVHHGCDCHAQLILLTSLVKTRKITPLFRIGNFPGLYFYENYAEVAPMISERLFVRAACGLRVMAH